MALDPKNGKLLWNFNVVSSSRTRVGYMVFRPERASSWRRNLFGLRPRYNHRNAVRPDRKPWSGFQSGLPARRESVYMFSTEAGCKNRSSSRLPSVYPS